MNNAPQTYGTSYEDTMAQAAEVSKTLGFDLVQAYYHVKARQALQRSARSAFSPYPTIRWASEQDTNKKD